jgi:hypothetical protein
VTAAQYTAALAPWPDDDDVSWVEPSDFRPQAITKEYLAFHYFMHQVINTPSWPRSWANFSLFSLYSHRNARFNLHLLGQPNTFHAPAFRKDAGVP